MARRELRLHFLSRAAIRSLTPRATFAQAQTTLPHLHQTSMLLPLCSPAARAVASTRSRPTAATVKAREVIEIWRKSRARTGNARHGQRDSTIGARRRKAAP